MKQYPMYYRFYAFLLHNPLTKTMTLRVRSKYELICPAREQYIVQRTVSTIGIAWLSVFLEIMIVLSLNHGIVQTMIAIALGMIVHNEVIAFQSRHLEEKILQQFEQFISEVRHYYYVSEMIDEAIFDAMDHTSYEMRIHAQKLYDIITSDHYEELAEQYYLSTHNTFFHLMLSLCITVLEYGDRTIGKQSLFIMNLSNLKTEVNIELLKLKQINYLYAGLTFVILSPMTLLKAIELWAVSNLPELNSFYHSGLGAVTAILIIGSSLLLYLTVGELRESRINRGSHHLVLEQFLQCRWVHKCIDHYIQRFQLRMQRLQTRIDASCEVVQLRDVVGMKFLDACCGATLVTIMSIFFIIRDHERYDWYELVLAILTARLCFMIPDIRLLFHRKLAVMGREEEIIQYQSIVLMLMYIERISVLEILERIEEFSYIFRKPIQNCINDYNASDMEALEKMKQETRFLPFQRFVDNLMISDEIGIERAFDEIAADREYFQEKRKQENEMNLNRRYEISKFIAYIPAILVIGAYLILPFLIECYRQLNEYREIMNTLY